MEVLLGLTPLDLIMKRTAVVSAYQLSITHRFEEGDLTGHLRILGDLVEEVRSLKKPADSKTAKLLHERPFRLLYPNREEFLEYFGNGSRGIARRKTGKGVGVRLHGPRANLCRATEALYRYIYIYIYTETL